MYRGFKSFIYSHFKTRVNIAVKMAFRSFEGIDKKIVDDFINSKWKNKHFINLNKEFLYNLVAINNYIKKHINENTKIIIYSQGSFREL